MSVQFPKECAEQQGNAAKRLKQEMDKGRRLMNIVAIVSLSTYMYHSHKVGYHDDDMIHRMMSGPRYRIVTPLHEVG